jgi:hypothetical protein
MNPILLLLGVRGWHAVRACSYAVAAVILAALTQSCAGTGQGWHPNEEGLYYLNEELMYRFFDVLRPQRQTLAWMASVNPDGGPYRENHGEIPMAMATPAIHGLNLCEIRGHSNCGSVVFGEEIAKRPEIRIAIEKWLTNFCAEYPRTVSNANTPRFFGKVDRERRAQYLRRFMGCDDSEKRPLTIFLYTVRDLDGVFNGSEKHLDATLERAVVQEWSLKIN